LFAGTPLAQIMPMLLPAILPFNLLKAGINSVVVFLLLLPLKKYMARFF